MSGDHNQYQKPTSKDRLQVEAMRQAFDFLHELWEMRKTIRTDDHKKVMCKLDQAIEQAEKRSELVQLTNRTWEWRDKNEH